MSDSAHPAGPAAGSSPSQHVNGAAALVRSLERHGVDTVFGIPGVHNLEIYRHLASSSIHHVAVRHEQGGGYAADGYARASGRPGICLTTSGPGVTNACTAAATAYADSVPVLLCSPGPPIAQIGCDVGLLHEMKDQGAHFESLLTASVRPSSPEEIVHLVDEVFTGWGRSRPRPVHLELPIDVLEGEWRPDGAGAGDGDRRGAAVQRLRAIFDAAGSPGVAGGSGATASGDATGAPAASGPDAEAALDGAAALLGVARRPLLVLGGGARRAAAGARLLAERLGALVITTVNGKGTIPETHPLSLGASIRLPATRDLFGSADAVLVIGSELGDSDLWGAPVATGAAVVRVDVDPHQLDKNLSATIAICMDASRAVAALLDRLDRIDRLERLERLGGTGAAEPAGAAARADAGEATWASTAAGLREALRKEALLQGGPYETINRALSGALPDATIVAGDSAQVSYFGTTHFWPMARPGQFLYPTGYATLGYGLPAAVGARFGCPDVPAIVLVGDGGVLFTVQEILTAVEQRLSLPVVIVDNHGYQEIREGMEARGIPPVAVDRPSVDFAALARSLGARGHAVGSVAELCDRTLDALTADGPTVISIDVADVTDGVVE